MLSAKLNLRVFYIDIILYTLVFGGSIVSVTHCKFSYVVGGQLQIFYMRGQQVIIKISSDIYAPTFMIFCTIKMLLAKKICGFQTFLL